jgi:hypothetical protein
MLLNVHPDGCELGDDGEHLRGQELAGHGRGPVVETPNGQGEDGAAALVAVNDMQVGADEGLRAVVDDKGLEAFEQLGKLIGSPVVAIDVRRQLSTRLVIPAGSALAGALDHTFGAGADGVALRPVTSPGELVFELSDLPTPHDLPGLQYFGQGDLILAGQRARP